MTGYIGRGPGEGRASEFSFTATVNQSAFSGLDTYGLTLKYVPGFFQVWVNGRKINRANYTATDGSTITFAFGLQAGDIVDIWAMSVFSAADGLSLSQNFADVSNKSLARANLGLLGRNRIINGQFVLQVRENASIADNAYGHDRFRVLTEAAAATIYANAFDAAGGSVSGGALQFTGTTDKGGLFQVIEGYNCKDLRGKTVVLSARLLVNNLRLGNIKMGIAQWVGTENATTGDPIASWGADGVTPTLAANWSWANTPANLNVTTTSAVYSVSATLNSTFTNLAVMIWNDDKSYTVGDNFGVTNVQLEEGSVPSAYDQKLHSQVVHECMRYCRLLGGWVGQFFATNNLQVSGTFDSPMLKSPTMSLLFGTAGLSQVGVSNPDITSISGVDVGPTGGYVNLVASAGAAGAVGFVRANVAKIVCNAEI